MYALAAQFECCCDVVRVLEVQIDANRRILRREDVPPLYESGVRWGCIDCRGLTEVFDVLRMLTEGFGECASLSAWRIAELREQGVNAQLEVVPLNGDTDHVVVRLPGGRLEDPSALLGMSGGGRLT